MAKQTRIQRGLASLPTMIGAHPLKRGGYCHKTKKNPASFDKLVTVARSFGFRVFLFTQEDYDQTGKAVNGTIFRMGGYFRAPDIIKLAYKSYPTLAHELAHGLDFQLEGNFSTSDRECVAIGVEWLVTHQARRGCMNRDYAEMQGVTEKTLERNCERIEVIFDLLMERYSEIFPSVKLR